MLGPGTQFNEKADEGVSIPNLITLGRVILVPVVFWLLITHQLQAAFLAFVVAGISDAVDGFLAKRYNWETELGAYLDPIADKLLIVSIFIALGVSGKLPPWIVIAVVSRDILIVIGVILSWLLNHPTPMKPIVVSKANTVAQIVLAATVLATEHNVVAGVTGDSSIYRNSRIEIELFSQFDFGCRHRIVFGHRSFSGQGLQDVGVGCIREPPGHDE